MNEEQLAAYNLGIQHQNLNAFDGELYPNIEMQFCYEAGRNNHSIEHLKTFLNYQKRDKELRIIQGIR